MIRPSYEVLLVRILTKSSKMNVSPRTTQSFFLHNLYRFVLDALSMKGSSTGKTRAQRESISIWSSSSSSPLPLVLHLTGQNPVSVNQFNISDRLNLFERVITTAWTGYKISPERFNVVAMLYVNILNVPNKRLFPTFLIFLSHQVDPLRTHHLYLSLPDYIQEQPRLHCTVYTCIQIQ